MIVSFSQARTEDCVDKGIDCKAHPKQQQSEIVQSHSAVIPRSIRSEREYWTVLGGDSGHQSKLSQFPYRASILPNRHSRLTTKTNANANAFHSDSIVFIQEANSVTEGSQTQQPPSLPLAFVYTPPTPYPVRSLLPRRCMPSMYTSRLSTTPIDRS